MMTAHLLCDQYKRAVSEFFDTRTNYQQSRLHRRMADRLVQLASPQPGEQVLDIATGTGFVSISAAHSVGKQGTVIGIDISAGMLKQAAQAVEAAAISNIHLVQSDAEALDYPASSFDLITCCNALPYLSDIPAALRHWNTLLRPGGRLAFNCWSEDSHATGHLLRTFARKHGIRMPTVGRETGSPERCRTILANAGFTRVEVAVEATISYWSVDYLEDVLNSALKNPLFGITPDDRDRLRELRGEYMAEAQSPSVRHSVEAENGAYFVLAYK